jgi:hypothetical protein
VPRRRIDIEPHTLARLACGRVGWVPCQSADPTVSCEYDAAGRLI